MQGAWQEHGGLTQIPGTDQNRLSKPPGRSKSIKRSLSSTLSLKHYMALRRFMALNGPKRVFMVHTPCWDTRDYNRICYMAPILYFIWSRQALSAKRIRPVVKPSSSHRDCSGIGGYWGSSESTGVGEVSFQGAPINSMAHEPLDPVYGPYTLLGLCQDMVYGSSWHLRRTI